MALLDPPAAKHFCASYTGTGGAASGSFRALLSTATAGTHFVEGVGNYTIFRDAAVRESERLLFMAASNYRRSHDLLLSSSSPWAHVTMYYGAFFAASALLGLFGAWKLRKTLVLDVAQAAPGALKFQASKRTFTASGSHEIFWEFFYAEIASLVPWVDPLLAFAIAPVSGDPSWQSSNRNSINYDSHASCSLVAQFHTSFRSSHFPTSLPGAMNTQFLVTEGLLTIATSFAKQFGLDTDVLASVVPGANRRTRARELILRNRAPRLGRRVKRVAVTG